MKKIALLLSLLFINITNCYCQDILGSTIKVSLNNGVINTYTIEVNLNIDTSSTNYRANISVATGNGDSVLLPHVLTIPTAYNYRIEKYKSIYTYTGNGIYNIHFQDSSWINNVTNFPQSNNAYYQNLQLIISPFFGSSNEAPLIDEHIPQFIMDTLGIYHSNIGCSDNDSNNIFYFKETCWVNGYNFPNELFVDSLTGDISFKPLTTGLFAISIKVKEAEHGGIIPIYEHIKTFVVNIPQAFASIEQRQEVTNDFTIFPNPTKSNIQILGLNNYKKATIYDLKGRILYEQNFAQFINVDSLPNGMYILELNNINESLRKRFIKE
jgi:hypothetical protein